MNLKLKPSQRIYFKTILSKRYSEILYAGTAGTGKSFAVSCLNIMILNDYSNSRLGVFRKNLTTARKTIWHTYIKALKILDVPYVETKGSEPKIYLPRSNSTIEFYEMDKSKDPDWNKAKGLELTFAHMEEANEIDVTGRNILITRIGRWNDNGAPAFICMTCNPAQGWVRDEYREPFLTGTLLPHRAFVETSSDELEPEYKKILETLPAIEKERYLYNNWNYADNPNQLIKYEWLKDNFCEPSNLGDEMGIDVAREGNDKSIISISYQGQQTSLEELNTQDVITVGEIAINKMIDRKIAATKVKCDVIGVGGGTVDYMRLRKYPIVAYNSGSSPDTAYKEMNIENKTEKVQSFLQYFNRRAQDYWRLRERLIDAKIKLLNDSELVRQLTNINYLVKDKYIQIESKADIKKRLGVSPDKADATCICFSEFKSSSFGFAFS